MVRSMTCPVCGKTIGPASDPARDFTPFCSDRCKKIDFFRWNEGKYAIVEKIDPSRLANQQEDELFEEE